MTQKIKLNIEKPFIPLLCAVIMFILGIFILIPSLELFFRSQEISTIENLIPYYTLTFPFPIARIVLVMVILTVFAVGAYTLKEMKSKKYLTDISQDQDKFQKTYSNLDLEISRKIYHIVIIVVLILYLFVAYMILDTIYHFTLFNLPQPPEMPPPQEIIDEIVKPFILDFRAGHILLLIAVSWIFIFLFFTDVVRIKKYRYYPIKMLAKIYRDKEQLVLAPHIYLTVGALFAIMLSDAIASFLGTPTISAHIVMITVMVSALADAIATIIGITKGNHHLKGEKSKKTWEGWIAGFISAIIFGLISYIILMPKYGGTIVQAVVLSLVAAAVFSIIDFFTPPIPISDNLLNPVAISLSLWGVSLLFFI